MEQVNTYTQIEVHSNISKLQDEVDLLKLRRTDITKRINELNKQIDAWKELDLSQIKMF